MITTLLLDVDGVLVSSSPDFIESMDRDYAWRDGVAAFLADLGRDPGGEAAIVGDGDMLTIAERILPAHVDGLTAKEFLDRMFREDITINQSVIDLVGRTGIKDVYLASNQDRYRGTYVRDLFHGEPWLTGALMSFDLGFAKPDPGYFTAALSQIDARPADCLFIDDRPANVAAATALGLAGLTYTDLPQLESDLNSHNLPPRRSWS